MANLSLIRSAAAGSIAAGVAVLCWFNRLTKPEQHEAERLARDYGRRMLDKARELFSDDEPPGPMSLIG